jgi:hypothetical protein
MNITRNGLRSSFALAMLAASVGFAGCSSSHDLVPATLASTQSTHQSATDSTDTTIGSNTLGQNYTMLVPLTPRLNKGNLTLSPAPARYSRANPCPGVNSNSGIGATFTVSTTVGVPSYSFANFVCNGSTPAGTSTRYVVVMVTNPGNSPIDAAAVPISFPGVQSGQTISFTPNQSLVTIPAKVSTHFFIAYF